MRSSSDRSREFGALVGRGAMLLAIVGVVAGCKTQGLRAEGDTVCELRETTFTQEPSDQTGLAGEVVSFRAVIFPSGVQGELSYRWQVEMPAQPETWTIVGAGSALGGDESSRGLDVTVAPELDGARYVLGVAAEPEEGVCDIASDPRYTRAARLSVRTPPAITTHPQSTTVLEGESASFTVVATGAGLTYRWQHEGTELAGEAAPTFSIASTTTAHAGEYRVTVTNAIGLSVTSDPATLTVTEADTRVRWTGAVDEDWMVAGNWNPVRTPLATDTVIIDIPGTVRLGDPDGGDVDVSIARLRQSDGVLALVGPSNCGNCANLNIATGISSTGAARVTIARATLRVGEPSSIADLREDISPAGAHRGMALTGIAASRVAIDVGTLHGRVLLTRLALTVSDTASLAAGASLDDASLTIGADAGMTTDFDVTGVEREFTGGDGSLLRVLGRADVQATSSIRFQLPVEFGPAASLDANTALFTHGFRSEGLIEGTALTFLSAGAQPVTLLPGSTLRATNVEFRAPTMVSGVVEATEMDAALGSGSTDTLGVSNAVLLRVGQLRLGQRRTNLTVPEDAAIDEFSSTAGGAMTLSGPGTISTRVLRFTGAATITRTGSAVPLLRSRVLILSPGGTSLVTLDGLGIRSDSTASLSGSIRGRNGARLILAGATRFTSASLLAAVEGTPGSLYIEHLGSFQPGSGPSTVRACITTGPTATVLAGMGSASLLLEPLPPAQCP